MTWVESAAKYATSSSLEVFAAGLWSTALTASLMLIGMAGPSKEKHYAKRWCCWLSQSVVVNISMFFTLCLLTNDLNWAMPFCVTTGKVLTWPMTTVKHWSNGLQHWKIGFNGIAGNRESFESFAIQSCSSDCCHGQESARYTVFLLQCRCS